MDKRALLDSLSGDAEERLVLARVLDRMEAAERRQICACTSFLSPRERTDAADLIRAAGGAEYVSLGGYDGSERQVLLFLPEWMEADAVCASDYLSVLRCTWFEGSPTHRDFLGALMAMGVRRDTVGDILVSDESCDLILIPSVTPFLRDNLTSAGRVRLKVSKIGLSDLHVPKREVKTLRDTVAALRLDSVLAVGFSVSRTKATQLISAGHCAVNWREVDKPDYRVRQGDVFSCRGLGRCRLIQVGGVSRKGRFNIVMERYL